MTSESVLSFFKEITRIPRESGHEGPMGDYLMAFAAARGLESKRDKAGNVLIAKPASPGKEDVPTLVLQAHQDMVCEKNSGCDFNFLTDPIRYEIEDGWMIAKETTLGADDGIGVAACLALLDSDLPMGRLECLFTISEETSMEGAEALEEGFFSGKTLINLDSEDEGQLFIGCAGGMDTIATFEYETEPLRKGYKTLRLSVFGGLGGHSGDEINKERANAIQQLARFLYTELQYDWQLLCFEGGNRPNAIAREATAVIAVPEDEAGDMRSDAAAFNAILKAEFAVSDPGIGIRCEDEKCALAPFSEEFTVRLISTLTACPHGVAAMSMDIPGLVETSTNLACVRMEKEGTVKVITSQRSSVKSALHAIAQRVEACLLLGGADVAHETEYPGWKPNLDSHLLKVSVETYRRLFNQEPKVLAIHAGLECGLFLEKFPSLDMISFGPTLRGVHAPGEKLEIASLDKFVALLNDIVLNYK